MVTDLVEIQRAENRRSLFRHRLADRRLQRRFEIVEPILPVARLGVTGEEELLVFPGEQHDQALVVQEVVEFFGRGQEGRGLRFLDDFFNPVAIALRVIGGFAGRSWRPFAKR